MPGGDLAIVSAYLNTNSEWGGLARDIGIQMMLAEWLFVETIADVRQRSNGPSTRSRYELLGIAPLIRKLLLDGTSLVDTVQTARPEVPVEFRIRPWNVPAADDHAETLPGRWILRLGGPELVGGPDDHALTSVQEFGVLRQPLDSGSFRTAMIGLLAVSNVLDRQRWLTRQPSFSTVRETATVSGSLGFMTLNNPLNIHQIEAEAPPATSRAVEDALNDHYYRVDPAEYFERRLWGIIAMADLNPDSVKWDRDDEASLFGQFQAVLTNKKIALDVPPGTTLNSRTMASVESYALMQHVIETALRLFVAGQERVAGKSPMTTLINMRQSADLREPIKSLLSPSDSPSAPGAAMRRR